MRISLAQMMLQVSGVGNSATSRRSSSPPIPAATPAATSPDESPSPAIASLHEFTTDMQVDDQHRVYYQFVDARSGHVIYEVPPKAAREIGESLHVRQEGAFSALRLDVKS